MKDFCRSSSFRVTFIQKMWNSFKNFNANTQTKIKVFFFVLKLAKDHFPLLRGKILPELDKISHSSQILIPENSFSRLLEIMAHRKIMVPDKLSLQKLCQSNSFEVFFNLMYEQFLQVQQFPSYVHLKNVEQFQISGRKYVDENGQFSHSKTCKGPFSIIKG